MGLFPPADQDAPPEVFQPPVPKWDPSTLMETECLVEEKGHGLLTERVISALLPMENNEWKGVKAAEDAMEGRPGGSGAAAARKEKLSVSDLETRIRDTMRYHGLLNEIVSAVTVLLQSTNVYFSQITPRKWMIPYLLPYDTLSESSAEW